MQVSALHLATDRGDFELVDALVLSNSKLNTVCTFQGRLQPGIPIRGTTPLHIAAANGSVAVIKRILGARAQLHHVNETVRRFVARMRACACPAEFSFANRCGP
jgi:ankyrin repeat protein